MKRTFLAIKIVPGDKMREIYHHFRDELSGEKIKWVDLDSMHITLCFLGDTREDVIESLKPEITETANGFPALKLHFRGCGIFKNIRDPRVIWIGMKPDRVLSELKTSLDNLVVRAGFTLEKRDFRPHLTIARIKWIRNTDLLGNLVDKYHDEPVQESVINEVIFYESILKPERPVYLPLLKAALKG